MTKGQQMCGTLSCIKSTESTSHDHTSHQRQREPYKRQSRKTKDEDSAELLSSSPIPQWNPALMRITRMLWRRQNKPKTKTSVRINSVKLDFNVDTGTTVDGIDSQTYDQLKSNFTLSRSTTKIFAMVPTNHYPSKDNF